jgi:SPX domain protein involved in polyphosphate accumulation
VRIKHFNRYELKYVLNTDQYKQVVKGLANYVVPDAYGDSVGRYLVTSLYYDTLDYKSYWDKIDGQRFRRKVRIRVYGDQVVTPHTLCFVEIKQRINRTLQKKRAKIPYSDAAALCGSGEGLDRNSEGDQAVVQEVQYLHHTLQLQPACVVSYDRQAFNGEEYDPGLRITFDTNLKCRTHELTLESQSYVENQYFVPPQWCVMEIKVNDRVPYWLTEVVNKYRCTLRRISKYCSALEKSQVLLKHQRIAF